jgi:hypothetical protein
MLCACASAGSASAATLGFEAYIGGAYIDYTAAPGEVNNLTVTSRMINGTSYLTFSDPGNRIKPDRSHSSADTFQTLTQCVFLGDRATCPEYTNGWKVILGDGDDSVTLDPTGNDFYGSEWTVIDGGDGADTLSGDWVPSASITLVGGPGDDHLISDYDGWMFGGPGADTMDYVSSYYTGGGVSYVGQGRDGVSVTLDGIANDGAPGEGDNVGAHIRRLEGSEGDDVIVANGLGSHVLYGRAGNDRLDPAGGWGDVYGEEGDDTIPANDGANQTISCGDGSDSVLYDPVDVLSADCEVAPG